MTTFIIIYILIAVYWGFIAADMEEWALGSPFEECVATGVFNGIFWPISVFFAIKKIFI